MFILHFSFFIFFYVPKGPSISELLRVWEWVGYGYKRWLDSFMG